MLPDGNMFVWIGQMGGVMDPMTGRLKFMMPPLPFSNISTEYPSTSNMMIRDVTPADGYSTFELMIFGGAQLPWSATRAALDYSMR